MNWKKVLGVVGAIGLSFAAGVAAGAAVGAAVGYIRAYDEIDLTSCPENCECAGDCSMCVGAHTVVAEAKAATEKAAVKAPAASAADDLKKSSEDAAVSYDPADANAEVSAE